MPRTLEGEFSFFVEPPWGRSTKEARVFYSEAQAEAMLAWIRNNLQYVAPEIIATHTSLRLQKSFVASLESLGKDLPHISLIYDPCEKDVIARL